ncbi:MAG: T9SS type A sorting domain-containing protein, partial [Bacteroidetes bacterium]|nr:T9SS type A sorting domain-containing protein [Bacteroidota bacterium]
NAGQNINSINTASLPAGMYILQAQFLDGTTQIQKVIKQ